jgi:CheY-like chemotaxis protein
VTMKHPPIVLLVDVDQSSRDFYGDLFVSIGFQVMSAAGIEGLSMALRRERPDVVIAELVARDLTVGDLCQRLYTDSSTRCIPVIVVTSSCNAHALDGARRNGAVAVLPKFGPVDELLAWVTALCPRPHAA